MKDYDPRKPSKFTTYLDMNNFYGWAMSNYLPYGGFEWLKIVDGSDVNSISEKTPIGYILEVHLEYPDEFHVLHNDYSLAPEKLSIHYDMLSDYCKKIAEEYGIIVGDVKKIIPNLGKENYLCASLQNSSVLFVFRNEKRTNADNNFEKEFFKLMINSVYGKIMENLRKRINVRLVNNKRDFSKYTSRPTHITHKIFNKNYASIHEIKPVLMLNKPIYVGLTVLELSK